MSKNGEELGMASKKRPDSLLHPGNGSLAPKIEEVIEQRYSDFLEISPNAIIISDLEGSLIVCNYKFLVLFGFSDKDELCGMNFLDLVFPIDHQRAIENTHRTLESGAVIDIEYLMMRRDGSTFPAEFSASVVRDSEIQPIGYISIIQDITLQKVTEQALLESERKFRSIVTSTPMGMHMYKLETDGRLVFIDANPAADSLLGVDHSQFFGKTIEEVFPPLSNTEIPGQYRQVALNGTSWSTEQIDYKDSQIQGAFEVFAFQTSPRRMVALFVDITFRKKAEQELIESENKHRTIVESIHDMVIVYDKMNRYSECYAAKDHLFYLPFEELRDRHVSDVLPSDIAYIHIVRMQRIRETTVPETFEYSLTTRDEKFWFESTLSLHENGESIVSLVRNITKRKLAENKIQMHRDFLERVIESLTHPFYVIDAEDYSIKIANNAAGIGSTGIKTCYSLTHQRSTPCTGDGHPCPLAEVKRTKNPVVMEHTHYDNQGNIRFHKVHGYPIFDIHGNVVQMIEYNLDITDQVLAEKQLEIESKRAGLYLDVLAHDMANHLQVISGYSELIREIISESELEIISHNLDRIDNSIQRSLSTISKAKDIERFSSDPLVERSLLKVLNECLERVSMPDVQIHLEIGETIGAAFVLADYFLEDLIINFLENAIKHNTSENKQIWIKLQHKDNGYELSIADNGSGIREKDKSKLFNPELRLGGMGLLLSAEKIDKYGGTIQVCDRVFGNSCLGAMFRIWLPLIGDSLK
jgi:PAS domain S-box-containing protein